MKPYFLRIRFFGLLSNCVDEFTSIRLKWDRHDKFEYSYNLNYKYSSLDILLYKTIDKK